MNNNIASFSQLKPQHFSPITHWAKEKPTYIKDDDTDVKYQKINTSFGQRLWYAISALTWAPLGLAGSALLATVARIVRVVTLKSLWEYRAPESSAYQHSAYDSKIDPSATLKARFKTLGKDAIMIPVGILAVIPAELSLVYSVISPQDGMKNADAWSRVIAADVLPPVIDARYKKPGYLKKN